MQYRPDWAAAMAIEASFKTHLRSGWNAYTGTRTHCGATLKFPRSESWVSVGDIEKKDITPDTRTTACERCIETWLNKAERNARRG